MKTRIFLVVTCIALLVGFLPPPGSGVVEAQDPQPGDPVVTGSLDLTRTVRVFPYDVDIYGIYLIEGDQMTTVTSVVVDHVNVDRVTAKLAPDGLKVAYLVEFGNMGFSRLTVVGVDGLNSQVLFDSQDPSRYITSFAWSHDSSRVAYSLSRDMFAASDDPVTSFDDPDTEINPDDETAVFDNPLELAGEVWVTDLDGEIQEQLVEQGAMDVLGWTGDDGNILFTRIMTDTPEAGLAVTSDVTPTRNITPTSLFAAGVSIVQTDALTDVVVSDVLTNTIPVSGTTPGPLYTDFYLLESGDGSQKLAVVSTPLPFETLPFTDTTLSVIDLNGSGVLAQPISLALTAVLTNSDAIVNVTIAPDGSRLAYMTQQSGGLWVADIGGADHTEVITGGLSASAKVVWATASNAVAAASLEEYGVQVFDLGGTVLGSLSAVPSDELQAEPLGAHVQKQLDAPYIHQLWDTPNWFAGYCACGPTSVAMTLAFYEKLSAHPIQVSVPYPHTSNYGFYVPEKHGAYQTRWAWDCGSGLQAYNKSYGLYGFTMVSSGYRAAAYSRIRNAIHNHGLGTSQDWSPTFNEVKAAIDRGHLVIMGGTRLTSAGHIVVVKGYTNDGRVVVHDPFGNFRKGSYGQYNGADSWYYWNDFFRYGRSSTFNSIEVNGTPPGGGGGGCGGGTPTITHWKGEYFNNRNLSGQAALVRNDTNVNFNWGGGSPDGGCIPSDNFSVRWTRTMHFERGAYRFRVAADDGVRLYVDGRRIIDAWWDQGTTTYESGAIHLSGGNHTVKLEYYEHGGAAVIQLSWRRVGGGSATGWTGEYYNNRHLSGSPTFTRNDDSVYFNWRNGGPGNGVGSDNFSVRWTKNLQIPRSGWYRFYARADDGVRLRVDGRLEINAWRDQSATTYATRWLYLNSGNHSVKMEYYEHGGDAYARLWLLPAFRSEFYNNRTLSGSPSWEVYYSWVWFDWWWGGPDHTSHDNFSARWTASTSLSGGRYQFCTRTDDGVRLYIDGTRVIDRWYDQGATTHCTTRDLGKGFHDLKMEYYERGGLATAKLWWGKYGGPDALAASSSTGATDPTEEDIWALYGDAGYLGPLVDADVSSAEEARGYDIFLPLVLRLP